MSETSRQWLMDMLEIEKWEDIPLNLRADVERMHELIDKAKPGCEIESSQIMALLVLSWEKEQMK